jgi:hypothetical protein
MQGESAGCCSFENQVFSTLASLLTQNTAYRNHGNSAVLTDWLNHSLIPSALKLKKLMFLWQFGNHLPNNMTS